MHTFFQQTLNGLSLGSIYALLALGYTMVYGIIKLINFAHGDVYMLGAFWGYYVINTYHVNFLVALVSAMVVTALAGMLIEYLAYRPLRNSPRITALITAIGVSYFLENGMSFLFGANTRNFPQAITQHNYDVFGITVSNIQILILVTSLVLMVLLQLIIQKKPRWARRCAPWPSIPRRRPWSALTPTTSSALPSGSARRWPAPAGC